MSVEVWPSPPQEARRSEAGRAQPAISGYALAAPGPHEAVPTWEPARLGERHPPRSLGAVARRPHLRGQGHPVRAAQLQRDRVSRLSPFGTVGRSATMSAVVPMSADGPGAGRAWRGRGARPGSWHTSPLWPTTSGSPQRRQPTSSAFRCRACKAGKLPAQRRARFWYFHPDDVAAFIEGLSNRATAKAPRPPHLNSDRHPQQTAQGSMSAAW